MIAHVCGYEAGDFVHTFGDAHIYNNHIDQLKLQISREPRKLPQLKILNEINNINDFSFDDFEILNYDPHPHIKGKVAV
jgi:thymidylate synthase